MTHPSAQTLRPSSVVSQQVSFQHASCLPRRSQTPGRPIAPALYRACGFAPPALVGLLSHKALLASIRHQKFKRQNSLRTHRRSASKPREVAREQRIARAAVAVAEVATAIPRFAAKHRPRVLRPLTTTPACGGSGHCDPRRGQVARALRPLERPDRRERRRARVRARAAIRTRCRDGLRLARRNAVHRARGGGWVRRERRHGREHGRGRVEAVGWVRGGRYAQSLDLGGRDPPAELATGLAGGRRGRSAVCRRPPRPLLRRLLRCRLGRRSPMGLCRQGAGGSWCRSKKRFY